MSKRKKGRASSPSTTLDGAVAAAGLGFGLALGAALASMVRRGLSKESAAPEKTQDSIDVDFEVLPEKPRALPPPPPG